MRVSVVINSKAGAIKADLLDRKIREALFRCDLEILHSRSFEETEGFIQREIQHPTDMLMVCGGDGTINGTLQILMRFPKLPPISIISSGTANDLAHEIGIGERIDEAARLILEGKEKKIDVIEVRAGDQKMYMLTNGGLGIPALTAHKANLLRGNLQNLSMNTDSHPALRMLSQLSHMAVKKMGTAIYSAMLLETLRGWKQKGWDLSVELPGGISLKSVAPFILVNNQPHLARKFMTAPYTNHADGSVNLTLVEARSIFSQLNQISKVFRNRIEENDIVRIFEVPSFKLKSNNPERKITFFGDGEILFRDVDEIHVTCLKHALKVMVKE